MFLSDPCDALCVMLPSRPVEDGPVCAGHDPDIWFRAGRRTDAMALCLSCPLRAECLAEWTTLDAREGAHGTWAGLTTNERLRIRRRYGTVTVSQARDILQHVK